MIAVDTNVLVRHLVGDDLAQARTAAALFAEAEERGESVFISTVVLVETAWVLTSVLHLQKPELTALLQRLVSETGSAGGVGRLVVEHEDAVREAIQDFTIGRAGFADYLIGRLAQAAGATTTYTFDRAAAAAPTFKPLRRA